MAQQEEPLYDFPEPAKPKQNKFLGHQRGRGSLRSISVLDRLLLTVPVWLQLSINPATALHILQREPTGTFLVRKSRTSQRNVLCVRLADDSVPSFVQQFGIREEHSSKTLSLETSAISFPDLPRLISFYCVSRDVLPFPLELPEAIAKATSHKELESISHMGIEFWSSHLNVRGPRETSKTHKDKENKANAGPPAQLTAAPNTSSAAQPDPAPQPSSENQLKTAPESDTGTKPGPSPTLFHEFCPITTRSPRELDCGSGLGALCFINPLFLQSQNALCKRRMFKRSLKVRVSTETSTLLSPPLAPPPPPPLMPKTKGKCKAQKQRQGAAEDPRQVTQMDPKDKDSQAQPVTQAQDAPTGAQIQPPSAHFLCETQEQSQTQMELQSKAGSTGKEAAAPLKTVMENLPDDSDYMQPSPMITLSHSPLLSPYLPQSVSPMAPPLFPKITPSLSPHDSPGASPCLSPYQSPSLSPKAPRSLSPYDSPSASPSLSPYQSPSPSPKPPFSLSPFTSPCLSPLAEQAYDTPAPPSRPDEQRSERGTEETEGTGTEETDGTGTEEKEGTGTEETEGTGTEETEGTGANGNDETNEELHKKSEDDENGLVLRMAAAALNDTDSCSSFSSLEGAAESPPHSPHKQDKDTSL